MTQIRSVEHGTVVVYRNAVGELHHEDGPAIEYADGIKEWRIHGKLHREDGPAVEWPGHTNEWYINGKQYTQAEHARLSKK